jgi:heme exporter protein A
MTTDCALSCESLEVWRGEQRLCTGLSFQTEAGQALRLHGANGAGKTTLIRILAGLSQPESGVVRWKGQSLAETGDAYLRALAYLGHANGLKSNLTPSENLAAYVAMMGRPPAMGIAHALARLGIGEMADRPCGNLSMGQQRRTALARLLLSNATLWLLDEPLTSLDASGVALLAELLQAHLDTGGIAIFATHQPLELARQVPQSITLGDKT